ncbi:MAG: dTDP-4-dehydrorhamnose 3,5-epimerase family protein [Acidimicrobiia bacterium]
MLARPSDLIPGVTHLALSRHQDDRGFFIETFRASWFPGSSYLQANLSQSSQGVLRGLHYHLRQEDLWMIPSGRAFVALADLRGGSDAHLAVETFELEGPQAVHIPVGVAHGFYAHTELLMSYLVTSYYDGSDELGVAWDDPQLAVPWPAGEPLLSGRDRGNPRWAEVPAERRP